MTSVAEKTFEEKKAMFGGKLPQLYGFEYYAGGIFVMPGALKSAEHNRTRSVTSSPYVSEWDWRNRHGKNWMTCVKDQGSCGSCWAHASLAALEAYINLYYNRLLNYSLSVEELISCIETGIDSLTVGCEGGHEMWAYKYIKSNGVVDSICFPYAAVNQPCSLKCQNPSERIFIENYVKYGTRYQITEGIVKSRLFKSPIPISILDWHHGVTLAGYKTIQAGDVLYWENINHNNTITISPTSHQDLIGSTAWLIKNSWDTSWGNNGYGYVVMDVTAISDDHFCVDGKITSLLYSDSDIVCEDVDGDGYYFWGVGSKPSHCPSWVPNTPDGDDSNINYGPIDAYGNLQSLPAGTTIKTAVTYNSNNTIAQHLGVVSGGIITVKATSTMSGNGKIRVCEGGKLIVDGGILQNADIELVPGCQVIIKNNGKINMASGKTFDAPEGAVVEIPYGSIN
jgi:C1A family cysteine protease